MPKVISTRILGGTLFLTGLLILFLFSKLWFWHEPPNPDYLQIKATISRIEPSRVTRNLKVYEGENIYYSFVLPEAQHYEGRFFRQRFSWPDYQVGQKIDVYYDQHKPWVNFPVQDTSQYWLMLPLLVAGSLVVIGGILLITGRDLIQEWKARREIAVRDQAFATTN